jgi:two-component system phosphate regulon sensor histidine kinase PhoR
VASVLNTQKPLEKEIVLYDNGDRFLQAHGTVLRDAREGEIGALVVLHDVTRLKKLEKVRRDFVANVSHELRTPVTSIKGFVETFLRIVASQTDRLNAIIEDLLILSRVEQEQEKAEIALVPGSVRSALEAALEVCQSKTTEKDIHIELTCDAGLQCPMNSPLLEQAVINLLDNAIKYSPPGQTVHLEGLRSDAEVVIRVTDHGCGISREHMPRIFERFYRVDKARSRTLGGTGLGLAIVKHITNAHGGRATVESTVGQGSVFSIHLPSETARKAPAPDAVEK